MLGPREAAGGVLGNGEDFPPRTGRTCRPRRRRTRPGGDDFDDSTRQRNNQWGHLPSDRVDRTGDAPAAGTAQGKSGRAWRAFRGHSARIQECAGDDFRLRTDDPGRGGERRSHGLRRADPGTDPKYYPCGDGIPEVRPPIGNFERTGGVTNGGGPRGRGNWGGPSRDPHTARRPFRGGGWRRGVAEAGVAHPRTKCCRSVRERGERGAGTWPGGGYSPPGKRVSKAHRFWKPAAPSAGNTA